jgi:predicted Zn-dependent protease
MAIVVRVGLAVVAVAAVAWFALGVRQAHDTDRATAMVTASAPLSPRDARRAQSLLDAAAVLNPDLTIDILRGELAVDQHHDVQAERILESVTKREPLNLQAWAQLAFAAAEAGDRPTLVRAARHVSALHPKLK